MLGFHSLKPPLLFIILFATVGCGGSTEPKTAPVLKASAPEPLRDEIKAENLTAVMEATRSGLGLMEQYRYAEAAEQFRKVRELAPGWIPGSVNLAIALLNDTGVKTEKAKKGGAASPVSSNFDEALGLLNQVIEREPKNLHARYCRGIILKYLGGDPDHPDNIIKAHDDFQVVVDADPSNGHAWYKLGDSLYDPESVKSDFGPRPAGPKQAKELIALYTKALERNPYLVSTQYQLSQAYIWDGQRDRYNTVTALWHRLNPQGNAAAPGEIVGNFYGDMGKYAQIINPFGSTPTTTAPLVPPRFAPPQALKVELPAGHRWAKLEDFKGPLAVVGRARARFGAASAILDADGDGKLDLFLAAAAVGPKGVHDLLLLNRGDGKFADSSAEAGLTETRPSLGVAANDFDADGRTDLFLPGVGGNALLRNLGRGKFENVTKAAGLENPGFVALTARWLDLDQDGDLDLYVLNHCNASDASTAFTDKPPAGATNLAYRNDGKAAPVASRPADNWAPLAAATGDLQATVGLSIAFTPWTDSEALAGTAAPHSGIAALDIDNDRDLDLVLLADGQAPLALFNDRLGAFHAVSLAGLKVESGASGLAAVDLDKDGRIDLVIPNSDGSAAAWRNVGERPSDVFKPAWTSFPIDAKSTRSFLVADLDLDTWPDLIGLSVEKAPTWSRNERERFAPAIPLALGPDSDRPFVGLAVASMVGDDLPDLVMIRDGEPPRVAQALGNGRHWLALKLGGKWKTSFDHMRTNSEGIGAQLTLEGEGLLVRHSQTSPDASLGQSSLPVVLGLGDARKVSLLHVRWPDGVLQSELGLDADQTLPLVEYNRKTGSCPVLFTWNGDRFVCLGDFLGGGGLGYLIAPGVYSQPDRDESMAVTSEQLKMVNGAYRISITEPMDEVAYLDHLTLEVVDRPPGVRTILDERFAPEGPRPSGALLSYRSIIEPIKVIDHQGVDRTDSLKAWDRRTADGFRRLRGWVGYAEDHSITLDFGDRLSRLGPKDRVVLALAGWVEYPYSQTNYAAATAGVALKPPVLERKQADGSWKVIDPHPGYPAGLPRMMSVDLTGKVAGASCVLRIKTNMECYWDQAFVAKLEKEPAVKTTTLPVARASLGYRGYTREVSPDGRLPLIYDYDYVDPAPLAKLSGRLTRYGDVSKLLQADDDQLCLVGPGDEARVEFDAQALPKLLEGWTRSFVLRSAGYCKDADPSTATSDTVGPLPWRAMPAYPFAKPETRPSDPAYDRYLREYQTRTIGR